MSHLKINPKLPDNSTINSRQDSNSHEIQGSPLTGGADNCTYAVTVSKPLCSGQRSCISIHSTDQLCQLPDAAGTSVDECNVEVLSLNEVFPSTSEESEEEDGEMKSVKSKVKAKPEKNPFAPSNSKSSPLPSRPPAPGLPGRPPAPPPPPPAHSSVALSENTLYVVGSDPGEPKMSYADPPKKMSKTMKKFLRNVEKQKSEGSKGGEKAISKLTTMRGILKDARCVPECTGDSGQAGDDNGDDVAVSYPLDYTHYSKTADKNVTFNTQVVIIHFTGDLCVGQSVETLSKEKDQQARNSELRKTFLTKYNELWQTQK
ncbi:histone-lysine N-methyltransferase SETD1B [Plutella xylostella]|uniref:histone-lysine N-methyltransferase SETD1B n=1 Tax=Plutella xylostella TaxID=51655 RepID=UPI002032C8A5|nr:histone-lysine N-methyltransferase SETD1B [Plutella xylostella]